MYTIEIHNHVTKKETIKQFATKKEANLYVSEKCEKRGYSWFDRSNRSLEYRKLY